ncbi:hypothetical protein FKM82_029966 [Ascaphus truei]
MAMTLRGGADYENGLSGAVQEPEDMELLGSGGRRSRRSPGRRGENGGGAATPGAQAGQGSLEEAEEEELGGDPSIQGDVIHNVCI